ncbi:MAG: DNA/RNA non-specific endonuclease [Peptostreptococcaceae bacterium]|nr:DNA/RNA non-specific endonuclease [Peptostreptococcaceae bacterium]
MSKEIVEPKTNECKNFAEQKAKIEQEALARFMKTSGKEKKAKPDSEPMKFSARQNVLKKYDSIAMERILGKSDLFPISYLQTGLRVSEAVCRISIRNSKGNIVGYGTGFLLSDDVLMTNNHVIENESVALNCIAEFNYQDDENFMPCPTYHFRLDPETLFITNEELDYTLVAVAKNTSGGKNLSDFGFIPLKEQAGKILEGEYVSIVQHPNGGPKSVTLRENQVSNMLDNFIHYLTDTEPGSSGSPVFNDQWILVALHHSGVPHPDKKGEWIANEGVRISSIAQDITKQYPSLDATAKARIDEILPQLTKQEPENEKNKTKKDKKDKADKDKKDKDKKDKTDKKDKKDKGKIADTPEPPDTKVGDIGYDPKFLDKAVPLPELSAEMQEDATRMKDGNYVLDYVHFSIVMRKSRGLAYFTAVNIDGNQPVNIARSGDSWNFDPRIEEKYQYGNEVYSKNDLDRGHLVRRKDPNWGKDAKQANADTFHFTNSAPQHKNLNQKIWLELEDYVLNNAQTHALKVSVFSGPVFRDDDMVYRKKYKIPAEFWKVVVMVKTDGKLSATAYLQTQKNMIDNLEFAYGEYKTYQVPVSQIEQITGLDFGELRKFDPIANNESAGLIIEGKEDIKL